MFLRKISIDGIKAKRNTAISLFSGCGGMDLGMIQAGFEVRVMIDNDPTCCDTLRANFTQTGWKRGERRALPKWMPKREPAIICRDITQTSTEYLLDMADLKVGECGCVTGGFPCQGFSTSGKRRMWDPRNVLYKECVRVVREALPWYFVFENVPGLVSMDNGRVIDRICRDLADCGYDVQWEILNAKDYGVPQDRPRVFFVGHRRDVLALTAKGKMQLHIGCPPGTVTHPKFYMRKYARYLSA